MSNLEQESNQEILKTSEESTAFSWMMWANSLVGTGNTKYQNEFYQKQAEKISRAYQNLIG